MKPFHQVDRHRLQKFSAALLVLVIAGFGFVQAVHVHYAGAKQSFPASHCSLCVVAHSEAIITAAGAAVAPVVTSAAIAVSDAQLQSHLEVASSFIRPPPQSP
jgi:hypothetical protein